MQTECGMRENNKTFTETNKIIVYYHGITGTIALEKSKICLFPLVRSVTQN